MSGIELARSGFLASVRQARVAPGQIALWYLGGAGYIVRSSGATLLVDPFLGPSSPPDWVRAIPPPFAPEELPALGPLDAVFLTHEHGDHADPIALRAVVTGSAATVYGPQSCVTAAQQAGIPVSRCHLIDLDGTLTADDLRVTAVPMIDPLADGCNGYVLETGGVAVLLCGDSLYHEGFVTIGERWRLDAICVSVGANPPGRTFYMDEADAARTARDSGARMLIPQHYDLWQGFTLDPRRVRAVARWYAPDARVEPARFCRRLTVGD